MFPSIKSFVNCYNTELKSNLCSSSVCPLRIVAMLRCYVVGDAAENCIGCFVLALCDASWRLRFSVLFTRSTWHYFSRLSYFFISGNLLPPPSSSSSLLLLLSIWRFGVSQPLLLGSVYSNIHYGVWFPFSHCRKYAVHETRYGNCAHK